MLVGAWVVRHMSAGIDVQAESHLARVGGVSSSPERQGCPGTLECHQPSAGSER